MRLLPMGSSDSGFKWHAKPEVGEEVDPTKIRQAFFLLCMDRSLEIADMRDGSFVLTFPDGIDPSIRAQLYQRIISTAYVVA